MNTHGEKIRSSATPTYRSEERKQESSNPHGTEWEDEEFRRTGIIQSERQVFELAREYFGLNKQGGTA